MQTALNDALKEELHRLKIQSGQIAAINGNPAYGGLLSQFTSQLALNQFGSPPSQQAQQQPQRSMHPSPANQPFNRPPHPDSQI